MKASETENRLNVFDCVYIFRVVSADGKIGSESECTNNPSLFRSIPLFDVVLKHYPWASDLDFDQKRITRITERNERPGKATQPR